MDQNVLLLGVDGGGTRCRAAATAVRRQAQVLAEPVSALVERLHYRRPDVIVTCARGSSAHAATFAKHLVRTPPWCTRRRRCAQRCYRVPPWLHLQDQLFVTVSQSGCSDDLIETAAMARAAGAVTAAIVNEVNSPVAKASEFVLPLAAGPELSVAATKSFVASLAALLQLTAAWTGDAAMMKAGARLPDRLPEATWLDWSEALHPLRQTTSLVAVGRGPTLAIAREAALKLKETCELHAETFNAAEFRHGPIALVSNAYPVLIFAPTDESAACLAELIADPRGESASVLVAEPGRRHAGRLPALPSGHPDADAICLIQSFYAFLIALAAQRGTNVDRPRHVQKVTRTR